MNGSIPTNSDTPSKGKLQINVTSEINHFPVSGANIRISYTGIPDSTVEEVTTDPPDSQKLWSSMPSGRIQSGRHFRRTALFGIYPFLSLLRI